MASQQSWNTHSSRLGGSGGWEQEGGLFPLLDSARASQAGVSLYFVYVELVQTQVKLWCLNL